MSDARSKATSLLASACRGDDRAANDLLPVVYERLRSVAMGLLVRERMGHTLQPTALVHEAWIDLIDQQCVAAEDGDHARRRFVGLAAAAMRRVLVDHARRRGSVKRGGGVDRVTLPFEAADREIDVPTLLDLEDALTELAGRSERMATVAELKLFGGLTLAEIAATLEVSLSTATEDWMLARALLSRRLDAS